MQSINFNFQTPSLYNRPMGDFGSMAPLGFAGPNCGCQGPGYGRQVRSELELILQLVSSLLQQNGANAPCGQHGAAGQAPGLNGINGKGGALRRAGAKAAPALQRTPAKAAPALKRAAGK